MPKGDLSTLKKTDGKVTYNLVGIRKATAFYGFCQKHDCQMFSSIDNIDWEGTEKQIVLAYFRSICFEMFQKMRAYSSARNMHDTINAEIGINPDEAVSDILFAAYNHELGLKDMLPEFNYLQEAIINGSFTGRMTYASWKINSQLPIACFGVFSPAYDVTEIQIQDYNDRKTLLESIFLAIIPTSQGSRITVASPSDCMRSIKFIKSLLCVGNQYVPDIAVKLIMEYCENHCCDPVWFNEITPKKRKNILNHLQQLGPRKINYVNFPRIIEATASLDYSHTNVIS